MLKSITYILEKQLFYTWKDQKDILHNRKCGICLSTRDMKFYEGPPSGRIEDKYMQGLRHCMRKDYKERRFLDRLTGISTTDSPCCSKTPLSSANSISLSLGPTFACSSAILASLSASSFSLCSLLFWALVGFYKWETKSNNFSMAITQFYTQKLV